VKANRERYFSVQSHHEKKAISSEIVKSVFKHGRFLKRDRASRNWIPVSTEVARIKVAHALQYRRRRLSKAKEPRDPFHDYEDEEEYRLAMKFAAKGRGNQIAPRVKSCSDDRTSETNAKSKNDLQQEELQIAMQYAAAKGLQSHRTDLDPNTEAAIQILMSKNNLLSSNLALGGQGEGAGLQNSALLEGALLGQSRFSPNLSALLNLSQGSAAADPSQNISRIMQLSALQGASISQLEQARNIASLAMQFADTNPGNINLNSASARLAAMQYEASLLANNTQLSHESRAARIAAMQQTAAVNSGRNVFLNDSSKSNLSDANILQTLASLRAIDQDAAIRLMIQSQHDKDQMLRLAALQYASLQTAAVGASSADEDKATLLRSALKDRPSVSIKYLLPEDTSGEGGEEVTNGSTVSIKYDESTIPLNRAPRVNSGNQLQQKDSSKFGLNSTAEQDAERNQKKKPAKRASMTKKPNASSSLADWSSRQGSAKLPFPVSTSHKLSAKSGGSSAEMTPEQNKKGDSKNVVDAAVSLLLLTPSKAENESD
jgi:hypothetical protein